MDSEDIVPSIETGPLLWASAQIFIIKAGREGVPFPAIANHIRRFSPDFGKDQHEDLNGKVVILPDIKPKTLETVFNWLYTGSLTLPEVKGGQGLRNKTPSSTTIESRETSSDNSFAIAKGEREISLNGSKNASPKGSEEPVLEERGFPILLDLYIFAQNYGFRSLRIEVIQIWQKLDLQEPALIPVNAIQRAYESLPAQSPLLKFIAETYAAHWVELGRGPTEKVSFPLAFYEYVTDYQARLFSTRGNKKAQRANCYQNTPCEYHEHLDDAEKKACRAERWAARELEDLRKRKRDYMDELPRLQDRIALHKECLGQYEARKKLDRSIKRDGDGLFVSAA